MSLIHWWPLNGNLKDYGIKNFTLTGNATVNNSGKIGKCYSFNGSNTYLRAEYPNTTKPSVLSLAAWYKANSIASGKSHYMINCYESGGAGLASGDTNIKMQVYCNGNYYNTTSAIPDTNWHHWCGTFDGRYIKIYMDGVLKNTYDMGSTYSVSYQATTPWMIGSNPNSAGNPDGNYTDGVINDVRIYDHALSVKEIKEISKGLVLHYTFEDAYAEGTTNIRPWSSTINSTTITGWDASKNDGATAYTRSGWGYGYNSGVPSPSIGYHAHWVYLDGELVMKFPNLNNEVGQRGRWLGISASLTIPWTAGKKYTISWEQRTDNLNLKPFGGIYYKLTSSSNNAFNDGMPALGSNTKVNVWEKVSKTFTVNSGYDGSVTSASIYVYGYNSTHEGTVYVRNVQIEYKDHATPFTASSRSNGLIYDSSGYGNNAVISGNIQIVPESASGLHSMKFDGSSAIRASNFYLGNEWSYGCWIKSAASSRGWEGVIIQNTDGGDADMQLGFYTYPGGNRIQSTANGQYNSSISYTYDDTWKHLFATFDGANLKTYINGQLANTKSITNALLVRNTVTIGARYRGSSYDAYFLGNIDDVKFYAKVFSAEEVLAEYQTKASIDRDGNLYTGEFVEENDRVNIAKTDVVEASVFEEGTSLVKMTDKYIELEYIGLSGAQQIDTGTKFNMQSGSCEITFQASTTSQNGMLIASTSGNYFWLYYYSNANKINLYVYASGQKNIQGTVLDLNKHTIVYRNKHMYIDEADKGSFTVALSETSGNVYIGSYGGNYFFQGKVFNCRIYDSNGTMIRNFIPAKRKSDNVIGMYDTVNRQFYTNSGSGSFTAGPEKGNLSIVYSKQIIEN